VGATIFLTAYTFVSGQQFFFLIGTVALASALFALLAFREPAGSFAEEYHLSSVDHALEAGHTH
jgi:NNP family nitrate/nitrite transporter-like MFS transporter